MNFEYKPLVFDAKKAHKDGIVSYQKNGVALLRLHEKIISVPPDHQYDLTQGTIFGLNERLTASFASPIIDTKNKKTLRDRFDDEFIKYKKALVSAKGNRIDYGVYAYYPLRNDLVKYCDPYWHRVVAIASGATLLSDSKGELSWAEIRNVLENTVIAIAGASVGSVVFHTIGMDFRPQQIKIADRNPYKMENMNRVRLSYWDMVRPNSCRANAKEILGNNKAEVVASQLYALDPFIKIFTYEDGVHDGNMEHFFQGAKKEPKADILIEEIDDLVMKVVLREKAREYGLPFLMVSDFGSLVQLDVRRFDKNKTLPLALHTSDENLYRLLHSFTASSGNKEKAFQFVDALVGTSYRRDELGEIIDGKKRIPTQTLIPQLGSTIAVAGGIIAETVARIRLGYDCPQRVIFDKRHFTMEVIQ
jgi:hypothetical protein